MRKQITKMVRFPIMFDGFSSFSIGLMSMMIQLICAISNDLDIKCGLKRVND